MSAKGPSESGEPQSTTATGDRDGLRRNGTPSADTDGAAGGKMLDSQTSPDGPPRRLLLWEQMLEALNLRFDQETSRSEAESQAESANSTGSSRVTHPDPHGAALRATVGELVRASKHGRQAP